MSKPVIAIFGTNGFLGKPTIEALSSPEFADKFSFPAIAITRDASKKQNTDKIVYREANIDDNASLEKALEGIDVFVNIGPVNIDLTKLVNAAIKGGAKLYIPSEFGCFLQDVELPVPLFKIKSDHAKAARALGIKTVAISTGSFAAPGSWLYDVIPHLGHNPSTKTVTIIGDPKLKFAATTLNDVGKSIAAVASTDISKLPDEVRIFSEEVTPEEVYSLYEKNHNVVLKRETRDLDDALKDATARLDAGFKFEDFTFYLDVIRAQGVGKGLTYTANEREIINPNESVFKWEKVI